jgi:hypothetical protein
MPIVMEPKVFCAILIGRTVKPSHLQYIFAKGWPLRACLIVWISLGAWVAVAACHPSAAMFRDWIYLLLFIVSVAVAAAIAFYLSLPFAFILLGPFYHLRARLNGAPFHVGDRVHILVGPHRDRVARIHEVWNDRSQVRVELDDQETGTFSFTEVCRESAA